MDSLPVRALVAVLDFAYSLLPTRKTFLRASLFSLFGMLPFLLILLLKMPHIMLPLFAFLGYMAHQAGLTADLFKQLRWMKRMSSRGPIFWAMAAGERLTVRLGRRTYGDKLDVVPLPIKAVGTRTRSSVHAKIEWIPGPLTSSFSLQTFDVQIRQQQRPAITDEKSEGPESETDADQGWVTLVEGHKESHLVLKPLMAETPYEVRVRAANSKGSSPWKALHFVTKQSPILMPFPGGGGIGGGGGSGPCSNSALTYRWLQNLKDMSVLVMVGPMNEATKAWQVEVSFRPNHLKITLFGKVLLEGELTRTIQPDDCSWELSKKPVEGGDSPEIQLTLIKAKAAAGSGKDKEKEPLWAGLLKGHPEIDTTKLKREDKNLDEIMAELREADPHGLEKVEQMKKEL